MRVVFVVFFSLAAASPTYKQYRSDYEYNSNTDAFYKLHIKPEDENDAKSRCRVEGAELMAISSNDDIMQVHKMLKQFPDIGNYVLVAADGLEHESAEETPIFDLEDPKWHDLSSSQCEVVTREGKAETSDCSDRLPYMCKIKAVDVVYDPRCKVYSSEYEYYKNIGSCYKISQYAVPWNIAYEDCRVFGTHLVVINSEAERSQVYDILNAAPRPSGSEASWFVLAGIRVTDNTKVFKTIFNQTLAEAGFAEWTPGEPNNASNSENCGSIFLNDGKYNDVDCSQKYGYMCEIEV